MLQLLYTFAGFRSYDLNLSLMTEGKEVELSLWKAVEAGNVENAINLIERGANIDYHMVGALLYTF